MVAWSLAHSSEIAETDLFDARPPSKAISLACHVLGPFKFVVLLLSVSTADDTRPNIAHFIFSNIWPEVDNGEHARHSGFMIIKV